MARSIRGNEFANRAADSRYPLIPYAAAKDGSCVFEIPNDFLVGLYIAIPADLQISPATYQITTIVNVNNRTLVSIGGKLNGTLITIGRFDILWESARAQITERGYAFANFIGEPNYADLRGRLMVGSIDSIAAQPQGSFGFSYGGAGLSVDCFRPIFRHLSALNVLTSTGQSFRLSGAVRLRGGDNVDIKVEIQDGVPVVMLNAVDGSKLNESFDCDSSSGAVIKTINGLPGNVDREVTLIGSRCLAVEPSTFGVQFTNGCSEPCASCEEAEALKSMVDPFSQQLPYVISVAAKLEAAIIQMQQTVNAAS